MKRPLVLPCIAEDLQRVRELLGSEFAGLRVLAPEHLRHEAAGQALEVDFYTGRTPAVQGADECWLFRGALALRSGRLGVWALRTGARRFRLIAADSERSCGRRGLVIEIVRAALLAPVRAPLRALARVGGRMAWLDAFLYRLFSLRYRNAEARDADAERIHFFVGSLGLGGTQRQLIALIRHLVGQGFRCKVWVVSRRGFFEAEIEQAGAEWDCVFDPRAQSAAARRLFQIWRLTRYRSHVPVAWALARQLTRERPTVLQCLLDTTNVAGALAGRMAGVPVVVAGLRSLHPATRVATAPAFHRSCYRLLDPALIDAVVANSHAGRASFLQHEGRMPAHKLRVVHNGLDAPPVTSTAAATRGRLGLDETVPVLLWVGRMVRDKRLDAFLAACQLLVERGVVFQALVVGHGRDAAALGALARPLSAHVQLLGHRRDVGDLLRVARALVLSSEIEGLPNVILEAYHAARPVVATRVGGVPELVEDGVTGFLVDVGDTAAAAERLARLLGDPELASAMGRAGAARARAAFSVAAMGDRTLAIYRELAERRAAPLRGGVAPELPRALA